MIATKTLGGQQNRCVLCKRSTSKPGRPRVAPVKALPVDGNTETVQTASIAAIALAGASFVGTFFVLPQFRDILKEPVSWQDMYPVLAKSTLKALSPSDAYAKARRGAVLVDVRLRDKYVQSHAAGSICAPLYRPIQGWDLASNLRRAGFAFFGIIPGTELSPDFTSEVLASVPKGKEVVLICETGGSLDNKPGTLTGFQSRSLKAAYYLLRAGYTKVYYTQGGLGQWLRDDLPVAEGEDDEGLTDGDDDEGSGKESVLAGVAGRWFGSR